MVLNDKNIEDLAIYTGLSLISKGLSVSPLKLQKLLYYEQAWCMALSGRENTLFQDVPQAWVNGPVYPRIFHKYKNRTANMCDHLKASDFAEGNVEDAFKAVSDKLNLSPDYLELLESVIMLYGAKTQNQLIFMTHAERPWAETRGTLPPYERSEKEIPLDLMYSYYRDRHQRNARK